MPYVKEGIESSMHLYVIQLKQNERNKMINFLREKGRTALQKKHMVDSLSFFTQYIRLCHQLPEGGGNNDVDKNKLIHQGYVNRSMVFYRVENYVRCLDDCDAALYYAEDNAILRLLILYYHTL